MRQLDAEVARLARSAGRLRLVFGEALCVVAARSVQHELGFSSLGAYAQERCDVAVRWALDSQALARRLEQLPQLRQAVFSGEVGWSRAELLARLIERSVSGAAALAEVDSCAGEANAAQRRDGGVACSDGTADGTVDGTATACLSACSRTHEAACHQGEAPTRSEAPTNSEVESWACQGSAPVCSLGWSCREQLRRAFELRWLERGSSMTCLELRQELKRLREPDLSVERRYRLSLSLSAEDAWWLHAAEVIYERLEGSAPRAALFEALLAEATAELCPDGPTPGEVEQLECEAAWRSQLAQWRLQA